MANTNYRSAVDSLPATGQHISIATGMPAFETDYLRNYANKNRADTVKGLNKEKDAADKNINDYTQERYDTDPTMLNKWQNANYAKGQGQYGMFNNKDYGTTLKLAREVDAYNAAPREHHKVIGLNNQIQDLGVQYEKPNLETMESRAIQQSIDLDTNQKKKAQDLQAEINGKNWDAFNDRWKQLFDTNMATMKNGQQYIMESRLKQFTHLLTKDATVFNALFNMHMKTSIMQKIANLAESGDFAASELMSTLFGMPKWTSEDQVRMAAESIAKNLNMNWAERSEFDTVVKMVGQELDIQNKTMLQYNQDKNQGYLDEGKYRQKAKENMH